MRHFIVAAAALTVLLTHTFAQEGITGPASGVRKNLSEDIDKYLLSATSLGFSGSALIAKDDKVLLHKGYGRINKQKAVPITVDTRFWVASVSKQFTAAAVLKLEQEGKIGLTDSITKYFRNVPKDKDTITIHQLIIHTSGLGQNYAADGIADRDGAVLAILKEPLKGRPGEKFIYSNDNYTLLAAMIEVASGHTYESFLRANLFRPAGMSQTGFWGERPGDGKEQIAPMIGEVSAELKEANWGFRGATGISSTSGDLYKWHRALLTDIVLSEKSRQKLFNPYARLGGGGQYAYGWFVSKTKDGRDVIWARGNEDFGHNAIISRYADGFVTIVLSNAGASANVPVSRLVSAELEKILYSNNPANTGNSLK